MAIFTAFDDAMQIFGLVVLQAADPDLLHNQQRFQQRRPLAPRAAGDDLVAAPLPLHRRLDPGTEGGEIVRR